MLPEGAAAQENSHRWVREQHEHYVEPEWCSLRLFEEEYFEGSIWDPFCGLGRIPEAAYKAGHIDVWGSDLVRRGYGYEHDFFDATSRSAVNIVGNPPFDIFKEVAEHALKVATRKVALIWLVRTLPAAGKWLVDTPLSKILYLTPRPSMPPGHVIQAGEKPGGGKQDFCWLIWDHAHQGPWQGGWLHRDKA